MTARRSKQETKLQKRTRVIGLSLPRIGRHFGNRDHTTALHGIRQSRKRQSA